MALYAYKVRFTQVGFLRFVFPSKYLFILSLVSFKQADGNIPQLFISNNAITHNGMLAVRAQLPERALTY